MSAEVIVAAVGTASGWMVAALMFRQNRKLSAESDTYRRRLADVEDARRQEEMRPPLGMEANRDGGGITLAIRNDGLVEVVDVVEAPPVIVRDVKSLVGAFFPLSMGAPQPMTVATDPDKAGGRLVLRLQVTTSSDRWEQPLSCEVPDTFEPRFRWAD